MVIYKFPPNSENKNESKKNDPIMPDSIYIEEESQESPWTEGDNYAQTMKKISRRHYSASFRVVTAMLSIPALIIAICLFIFCLISGALAGIGLFRNEGLNANFQKYWKWFRRACVFVLSLIVATLSPAFGFSIMFMYFMLQGEELDSPIISRFINE